MQFSYVRNSLLVIISFICLLEQEGLEISYKWLKCSAWIFTGSFPTGRGQYLLVLSWVLHSPANSNHDQMNKAPCGDILLKKAGQIGGSKAVESIVGEPQYFVLIPLVYWKPGKGKEDLTQWYCPAWFSLSQSLVLYFAVVEACLWDVYGCQLCFVQRKI